MAAALFEQLVCHSIFGRQQVAASLFEEFVCYSIFGSQQVAASLFEQLVCYWHPWTTASGSFFIWTACVLLTSLDDSKWQPLYLSSLYVIIFWDTASGSFFIWATCVSTILLYLSINEYISGNLAEKVCYEHLPSEVSNLLPAKLIHLLSIVDLEMWTHRYFGSIICFCGLCKMPSLLGSEVVFSQIFIRRQESIIWSRWLISPVVYNLCPCVLLVFDFSSIILFHTISFSVNSITTFISQT